MPGTGSAKRGVLIGSIEQVTEEAIHANLTAALATGDGIVIEGDRFAGKEFGGRVYELFQNQMRVDRVEAGLTEIRMQHGAIAAQSLASGLKIWKTDDPQLTKRLRRSFESADPVKRVDIDLQIDLSVGAPIKITATCFDGIQVAYESEHIPELARKHATTDEILKTQFARLGGSVYRLRDLTARIEGAPMVPLSVLGQLRHELVERLEVARMPPRFACAEEAVVPKMLARVNESAAKLVSPSAPTSQDAPGTQTNATSDLNPVLHVLCRSLQQLEQVIATGVKNLVADFHDLREYQQAVKLARGAGCTIHLATLRIHKPGEDGLFKAIEKRGADGWLVRNLAALAYCRSANIPFVCDFSLNVTNPLTAEQLMAWGAERITASYDLNRDQLIELTKHTPSHWLEVVIHQHMPMFHMEHCVFVAY